jgi:hypothetical protein
MIHPSLFLRRALQADGIFSGVSAVLLTLGGAELAPLLNLPEALLRETGRKLLSSSSSQAMRHGRWRASRCCSVAR